MHSFIPTLPSSPRENGLQESLHDYFTREEEFLGAYGPSGRAAAALVRNEWEPNPHCNDVSRRQRDSLLRSGRLLGMTFDAAAIYHGLSGHSSVRIVLRSLKRVVTVRVSLVEGVLVAEKIADRKLHD